MLLCCVVVIILLLCHLCPPAAVVDDGYVDATCCREPSTSDQILATFTISAFVPGNKWPFLQMNSRVYGHSVACRHRANRGGCLTVRYTCGFIVPKNIRVHMHVHLSLNTQASHFGVMNEWVVGANKILVLW